MNAIGRCEADTSNDVWSESFLWGESVFSEQLAEENRSLRLSQGHANAGARAISEWQVADLGVIHERGALGPPVVHTTYRKRREKP